MMKAVFAAVFSLGSLSGCQEQPAPPTQTKMASASQGDGIVFLACNTINVSRDTVKGDSSRTEERTSKSNTFYKINMRSKTFEIFDDDSGEFVIWAADRGHRKQEISPKQFSVSFSEGKAENNGDVSSVTYLVNIDRRSGAIYSVHTYDFGINYQFIWKKRITSQGECEQRASPPEKKKNKF